MKLNLPNKLTVLRLFLVPIFLIIGFLPESVIPFHISCLICAVLFIGTALTDMFDGKIARRDNLITDFGKFLDPVADKFMVIGALFVILFKFDGMRIPMIITLIVIVFRELAVTSIRLVVSGSAGIVVAANMLGKIKTCVQIACVIICILERAIYAALPEAPAFAEYLPVSLVLSVLMLVFTLWSGINYIASYWKYMDPQK